MSEINFIEINSGDKGAAVSSNILYNFNLLKNELITLQGQVANLRSQLAGLDSGTSSSLTASVSVTCAPTIIVTNTNTSEEQVFYVYVTVTCGTNKKLYPGTDDYDNHFTATLLNSQAKFGSNVIANIIQIDNESVLRYKVTIPIGAVDTGQFSFKVTFCGVDYQQTIPIQIESISKNGSSPRGYFVSTVFKRSTTQPVTPTGGSYESPLPTTDNWSDGIPEGTNTVWSSKRRFTSDGVGQDSNWSTPVLAFDNGNSDYCYSAWGGDGSPKTPDELGLPHGSQDGDTSEYKWHDIGVPADIWRAESFYSAGKWSEWSILKIAGESGADGNWQDTIYKNWTGDTLVAPTNLVPSEFVDNSSITDTTDPNYGWHDGPTSDGDWWWSTALIGGATNRVIGSWSIPQRSGSKGVDGRGIFLSTVFKRAKNQPDKPSSADGTFSDPVPTGWSDGIPDMNTNAEENAIWETHRRFSSDGVDQDSDWSPVILAMDHGDFDCCYSSWPAYDVPDEPKNHGVQNDEVWHNSGSTEDNWMATSYYNSVSSGWSSWTITKIKGEDGNDADYMSYIFKEWSGDTLDAPNLNDTDHFVDVDDKDILNDDGETHNEEKCNQGWHDGPGTGNDWWMSCALIDGTTNKVDKSTSTNGWSAPRRMVGKNGRGVFMSTVFTRSASTNQPAKPTGGSFANPLPNETIWSDGIPVADEEGNPIWESHKKFTSDGIGQDDNWSAPILAIDSDNFDCCYSCGDTSGSIPTAPTSHGIQDDEVWHNEGQTDDIWMATSHKYANGDWSAWTVTRIKGEAGDDGRGLYTSTVFTRAIEQPDTPTGGSFDYPLPEETIWHDGIPAGTDMLWASHRLFTSDEINQDSGWTEPIIAADNGDFDCCYSAYDVEGETPLSPSQVGLEHGSQDGDTSKYKWHDVGTPDDIWMATSYRSATSGWSSWTVTRIKGENGANGNWEKTVYKASATSSLSAPNAKTLEFVDNTNIDVNSVNYGWHSNLIGDGTWWKSVALINGEDDNTVISDWTVPVKVKPEDGSYTYSQYAVNDSETRHPDADGEVGVVWFDTVADCYKYQGWINTDGSYYLGSGYYLWIRHRRYSYNAETGKFEAGNWEYYRSTGEKGQAGASVTYKGTLDSFDELFSLVDVSEPDGYVVSGDLYVWYDSVTPVYYNKLTEAEKTAYREKFQTTKDQRNWIYAGRFSGQDGKSTYIHIKYADALDNSIEIEVNGQRVAKQWPSTAFDDADGCRYIGVITTNDKEAPDGDESYSAYTWTQFVGEDGYGYEYIYKLNGNATPYTTSDLLNPKGTGHYDSSSSDYQDNDYVPYGWTDNPTGISNDMPYEFMFVRQKVNGKWQAFKGKSNAITKAILYNYYGKDAEYRLEEFAVLPVLTIDALRTGGYTSDDCWTRTVPTSDAVNGYYLWKRVCTVTPAHGDTAQSMSPWEYYRQTGERGDVGTSIQVNGTLVSYAALFSKSDYIDGGTHKKTAADGTLPKDGDCYIVLGDLWAWAESDDYEAKADSSKYSTDLYIGKWNNCGRFKGESGDTAYIHIIYADTATPHYATNGLDIDYYLVTENSWLTGSDHKGTEPGAFMAVWTDNTPENGSLDAGRLQSFQWSKNKGDDGYGYEYIYTRTATKVAPVRYEIPTSVMSSKTITFSNVISGYDTDGTPKYTTKRYMDSDFVPSTNLSYRDDNNAYHATAWSNNWTDNPMGPTTTLPYEWCFKRVKQDGYWGPFMGRADDLKTAFLYNKYGQDAVEVTMTNNNHTYRRNGDNTSTTVETLILDVTASREHIAKNIDGVSAGTVSISSYNSSSKQYTGISYFSIYWNASDTSIHITNTSALNSSGKIDFTFLVDGGYYTKTFAYQVTKDGAGGDAINITFSPSTIVATQNQETGNVSTASTYSMVTLYVNDTEIPVSEFTLSVDSSKNTWTSYIDYTIENTGVVINNVTSEYEKRFWITNFSKNTDSHPANGTAYFLVDYNGTQYPASCSWTVNWLQDWSIYVEKQISLKVKTEDVRLNLLEDSDFACRSGKNCAFVQNNFGYNHPTRMGVDDYTNVTNYCGYRAYIPSNQSENYYNGIQWGSGKGNNIKVTAGQPYTLSFWAKSNLSGSYIRAEVHGHTSLTDTNRTNESYGVENDTNRTNTNWKKYTLKFTPQASYIEVYLFVYNSGNKNQAHDAYFYQPMLNSGETDESWTLCENDADIIGGNILRASNTLLTEGNLTIVDTAYTTHYQFTDGVNSCIKSSNSKGEVDMLEWQLSGDSLEHNTDYVLSFDLKANTSSYILKCFLYYPKGGPTMFSESSSWNYTDLGVHSVVDSEGNVVTDTDTGIYRWSDGCAYITPSTSWKRCWVHFHTGYDDAHLYKTATDKDVRLLFRASQYGTFYIARPKLEKGTIPTEYISSESNQTIASKLLDTGIDIESRKVTVTADNFLIRPNNSTEPTVLIDSTTGKISSNYINANNITASGATFNKCVSNGFYSPWVSGDATDYTNDNIYNTINNSSYVLPRDKKNVGKIFRLSSCDLKYSKSDSVAYLRIAVDEGEDMKYFYEDGIRKKRLCLSNELVELVGIGDDTQLIGYIVLRRVDFTTRLRYGSTINCLAYGMVEGEPTTASIKRASVFDDGSNALDISGGLSVNRVDRGEYNLKMPAIWFDNTSQIFIMLTGVGNCYDDDDNLTSFSSSKATVLSLSGNVSEGWTARIGVSDNETPNDGSFNFMIYNFRDWDGKRY